MRAIGVLACTSQFCKPGTSHHVRALARDIRPRVIKLTIDGYQENRYNNPEGGQPQECVGGFVVEFVWCQADEQEAEAAF